MRLEAEDKNLTKRLALETQIKLLNEFIVQQQQEINRIKAKAESQIKDLVVNRIPGLEKKRDDYIRQAKELLA